jgi:seryl-tRNA synthetase
MQSEVDALKAQEKQNASEVDALKAQEKQNASEVDALKAQEKQNAIATQKLVKDNNDLKVTVRGLQSEVGVLRSGTCTSLLMFHVSFQVH